MYLTVEKSCGNDRTTWTPLKAQLYQLSLLPVAKGNVCEKPWDGKASSPTKRARKRKAAEISPSAVAAVNPRRSTEEEEPPAKKAKIAALTAAPALPEVSLLTKAVEEDDLEKFISEFLEEMEGQYDLELEKDVDELHLELSEMIDSISE
ncbi:zinc finger CCCH domain-containing protein 11A-like [Coturnix japonica]|uniref:zinc finger CCCH domain-containing protein 11A-like n=1 Tax=Coturnix japonica TaxID=93934 RepID=UPI0007772786|nr:zinc finger CCCH domain-containing protein 11A-like [Coturnix japonica]